MEITQFLSRMTISDSEEIKEYYRILIKEFPNVLEESFDHRGNVLEAKLRKINCALTNEILHGLEDEIRHKHVKVFLLWTLHKQELAEELNTEILEKDPDNILALTNYAFMFLQNEMFTKVDDQLKRLNELKSRENFSSLVARGKAEIAYCYSRISFAHYQQAITLYKEALQVCPNNYLGLFRMGLLMYRHSRNIYDKKNLNEVIKETTVILQPILSAYPHCIGKHLMAKTLVLLGSLENKILIGNRASRSFEYFERAYNIFPQDRFILEKSAIFYLTIGEYQRAQKLLEEAIQLNETSLAHYHLGKIYRNNIPGYRDFCIKKEPLHECTTPELKEIRATKKLMKCPERIPECTRSEFVNKAEYHFQHSCRLSPDNIHSIYDLALLYISLHEYENAKKCFESVDFAKMLPFENIKFSVQYGKFCFLLADEEESKEIKEDLTDDGTDMFVNAINWVSEIVKVDKKQNKIWEIKRMMEAIYRFGNTEYKIKLLELIQSIENLTDEDIFNKFLTEYGGNELSQELRSLFRKKKFQQAFISLEFSNVKLSEIDVNLRKTIYLEYAKDLYKKGPDKATPVFKKYYELCLQFHPTSDSKACDQSDKHPLFQYDVYILTSDRAGTNRSVTDSGTGIAESIAEDLKHCFGLVTSYGDVDCDLGVRKYNNFINIMKTSCNIGILYSKDIFYYTKYAIEIVKNRQPEAGKLFLINNDNSSEIPQHLQNVHNVEYKIKNNEEEMLRLFQFLCL